MKTTRRNLSPGSIEKLGPEHGLFSQGIDSRYQCPQCGAILLGYPAYTIEQQITDHNESNHAAHPKKKKS